VTSALSSPIWGKVIDRFGIKPVTLCAVTFFGCAMASIALTPPVLPVFLLLYAVAGVAGAGASPLPYAKAITGRFDRRRGLALGIAVAGVGVGGMPVPQAPQARFVRGAFGLTGLWFGDCRREKPSGLSERSIKNERRNWIILAQT
jgi:MFS family permease